MNHVEQQSASVPVDHDPREGVDHPDAGEIIGSWIWPAPES
jgi:hypothetical protein